MGIDSYITDPSNHNNAHIITHNDKDKSNALVVATHPLKTYENETRFFTSDDYGINMNIGVDLSTTYNIHDGTDHDYWLATAITGVKFTFDSTDQNHTVIDGAASVKFDNAAETDTMEFLYTTDIVLDNSTILNMWVYVDKDWRAQDNIVIYGWDSGTGNQVGTEVGMQDYFSFLDYDIWQNISIPLADMELTGKTIDAFRVRIVNSEGKSPKFYLDDILLQGTPEDFPIGQFSIKPESGTWLYIKDFQMFFAQDAYDSTVVGGASMPVIDYSSFLGVAAANGIQYQRVNNGEVTFSATIHDTGDFLQLGGTHISDYGSLGTTKTWFKLTATHSVPLILKAEDNDIIRWTISDNMAGLSKMIFTASCYIEDRT